MQKVGETEYGQGTGKYDILNMLGGFREEVAHIRLLIEYYIKAYS